MESQLKKDLLKAFEDEIDQLRKMELEYKERYYTRALCLVKSKSYEEYRIACDMNGVKVPKHYVFDFVAKLKFKYHYNMDDIETGSHFFRNLIYTCLSLMFLTALIALPFTGLSNIPGILLLSFIVGLIGIPLAMIFEFTTESLYDKAKDYIRNAKLFTERKDLD